MKNIALLLILALPLFYGCSDLEDNYSTNPNHKLTFSVDTLAFDTVFTTIGSTTKKFMVYNKNKEAINIESILLKGQGNSGFRMNVDGRKGTEFSNIGILPKDSMYVFVEVTVDPQDKNNPFEIKDSVEFLFNGIKQSILLQAYGQDAKVIKGGLFINEDTTFTSERPYLVYDSIVVSPNVTLQIEAGTNFFMHSNAKINVFGTINTKGSLESPVTFRGDRLDYLLQDKLAYDNVPGLWGGFTFHPSSYNNLFEHTIIRNGKNGITCLPSTTNQPKITFIASQVSNMTGNLLFAENCHIEAANSEFTNAEDSLIALSGGKYRFVHCTIANFMGSVKSRTGISAVTLLNKSPMEGKEAYPIEKISFENCIIDGSKSQKSGEIAIETDEDFEYSFLNCLVRQENDLKNSTNCIFLEGTNLEKYRRNGGKEENYTFDFRLKTNEEGFNAAIGKADIETARLYPEDRYGVMRVSETVLPDIGAYQYVPEPEEE
ncbi:hypothetical protein [Massilibacteroides sp.]|uniref:hypothetical protein n=1 Tax=Massilibacteroides sp. TaxID=2034766 RepID=UPI002608791F|nr:hypothetical protein [Massilibacteroides sp.]MDD4515949.1 hypothetical protein [Massilibacteroides sp.]